MTTMSAQETTPGHSFSTASFASSTTSKDRSELMLDRASFSPTMVGVSSSNTDPSQPCAVDPSTEINPRTNRSIRQNQYYDSHVDEAVVELEAHDGGRTPPLAGHRCPDRLPHEVLRGGAGLGVVADAEVGGGEGDPRAEEEDGEEEQQRRSEDSGHLAKYTARKATEKKSKLFYPLLYCRSVQPTMFTRTEIIHQKTVWGNNKQVLLSLPPSSYSLPINKKFQVNLIGKYNQIYPK